MARSCPVCGQRLPRKARVCGVCGEPIRATSSQAPFTVLAPTAGLQQAAGGGAEVADFDQLQRWSGADRAHPSRARLLVLTVVVVLGLALGATYAALRSAPPRVPDGAAYGVVRVSSSPKVRWQHPLAQIAPDLRCPTVVTPTPPIADPCVVTASATVADVVVVSVQRSQQAELVGLSKADGGVTWHRRAPAGSTYDCMVLNKRLWCLTVPLAYQPLSGRPQLSAAYRSAVLTGLDPTTGVVLRSSPIPGSSVAAAFAGVGVRPSGFYVLGRDSNSAGTVVRFSVNGTPQWNHLVTVIQPQGSFSGITGEEASPQVHELAGRALVSLSEVGGRAAIFAVQKGTPIRSAPGHVLTVIDQSVVTQVGRGQMSIGNRKVADNAVSVLSADDRSPGEPVLTTQFSTGSFVTRAPTDPVHNAHHLHTGEEPVAYCGGVIVTSMRGVFAGYDPTSGAGRWATVFDGGTYPQIRCTHDSVVITNDSRASGFSLTAGAQLWTADYPNGSRLTSSGYGDPQDGVVAGPANFLTNPSTSLSYLR
ncbi:MAG: PQQ-binding-like beta-propeller repeat protein [Allobranchiibius sp.]